MDKGYIVGGVSERVSQVNYLPEFYMAIKIFKFLSMFRAFKLLDIEFLKIRFQNNSLLFSQNDMLAKKWQLWNRIKHEYNSHAYMYM